MNIREVTDNELLIKISAKVERERERDDLTFYHIGRTAVLELQQIRTFHLHV